MASGWPMSSQSTRSSDQSPAWRRRIFALVTLAAGNFPLAATIHAAPPPLNLTWRDLVPAAERAAYSQGPSAAYHDYLGGESGPAAEQPMAYTINAELNGRIVRMPGFIVPLDVTEGGKVTVFFLVPFFGACIHVPPPPPNQIVYVTFDEGIALNSMEEAYWITGQMSTTVSTTDLGVSAYSIAASRVDPFR